MKPKFFVFAALAILVTLLLPASSIAANHSKISEPTDVYLPIVLKNSAPNPASNPYPEDGESEVASMVVLSWSSSDPDGDAIKFDVYLEANNPSPGLVSSDQTNMSYDPGGLLYGTSYYWQVIVKDELGKTTIGPVWSFKTGPPENMILIPEGEFIMGCHQPQDPETCDDNELPTHAVYLDSYFIDKYEVTNEEYLACVIDGVCTLPFDITRFANPAYSDHPVIYINWDQADNYCMWNNKRLLTEAEWEKAGRGSIDRRPYPWGSEEISCDKANYFQRGYGFCVGEGDTAPVGSYPEGASPYGVMDMIGNAWEWVSDYYHETYYEWSPYRNPTGPPATIPPTPPLPRMARGGCWRSYEFTNRVADRTGHYNPDNLGEDRSFFGIRCGMSLQGE